MDSKLLLGKLYHLILNSNLPIHRIENKNNKSLELLLEDNYRYKIKISRRKVKYGLVKEDKNQSKKEVNNILIKNSRKELVYILEEFTKENKQLIQILLVCLKLKKLNILTDYELEYILKEVEEKKDFIV